MKKALLTIPCLLAAVNYCTAQTAAHTGYALTPPMGWNSYDAYGDAVVEAEVLANATYMKEKLLAHKWQYVVVDYRWYDAKPWHNNAAGSRGHILTLDNFGRVIPAPNRFPSAADGKGFKPLADQIHAMGLKFGIHIMRGIPKQAVAANTPIEGSDFHAVDAANTNNKCNWNGDMWGVDAAKPAGQAYYDSLFRLYASWGVDYVKVDDLSSPYYTLEVEAIRKSIDKCGRPMVFSASLGETPIKQAKHAAANLNLWRVSGDFWDKWKDLDHAFDLAVRWQGVAGPGHWPDFDMIPFGRIGIRSFGPDRQSRFTRDEHLTLMTLWSIAPSPLMLGGTQPDNNDWTLAIITNDEVIAVNQDPLGKPGVQVSGTNGIEVWSRDLADGSKAVALFNRGVLTAAEKMKNPPKPPPGAPPVVPSIPKPETVSISFSTIGLTGRRQIRDLWLHKDLPAAESFSAEIPGHGCVLLKVK